ncbi:hypothetical protein CVT25_004406 [Psilocybe cyanescens]|uniref:DUF6534 domain-containing protein n=1 Tax=Psilocybe cyanescens TaxID=93625 RepID=A0A409XVZ7_PSICY|nr:hypothetical protein CVT25_004406 [Psilocybe cyanescens]
MRHTVDVTLVLGPMVFAIVFNAFIYGICVLQFCYYWETRTRDSAIIRLLVAWTLLLDTFHTCALLYMIWEYAVVHFNEPAFLATVLWPFSSTPIITTLTSFPIQIYLSWRIRQFSRSTRVFFGLLALAITQAALGLTCSIAAFRVPLSLIPFVDAWQVLAVATDVSITALLSWYLLKSRTGQKSSDSVICRVIRSSVETAAFGAFFCIMDLITFTLLQNTNFHVVFAFTLNSRKSLRAELERPIVPDIAFDQSTNAFPTPPVTDPPTPLKQISSEQQGSIMLNVTVYSTGATNVSDAQISAVQICTAG